MTNKDFLTYLKKNSVNNPDDINYTDISPLSFDFDEKELIGEGLFNKVYRVKLEDEYWIIKEGRYDLKFPLFKFASLPLPRRFFAWIFNFFNKKIMPTHEVALEQLKEYVLLSKYFGYFDEKSDHSVVGYDSTIIDVQRKIRTELQNCVNLEDEFAELVLAAVKTFRNYHVIREIINDEELREFNYLPEEYLILSNATGIQKFFKRFLKQKETYYIIQKRVEGEPLGNYGGEDLVDEQIILRRLIVFILLSMFLAFNESKVIDSRPESLLGSINEWFSKTGNIFLNLDTDDVKFVDTRWFWSHKEGSLIEKGFGELMINSTSKNLAKYVELINSVY